MDKKIALLVLLLLLLSPISRASTIEELLAAGDLLVEDGTKEDFQEASRLYEEALALDPDNGELLWRLGRSYLYTGDELPEDDRLPIYEKGREYAEKATEVAPDSPDAHYWFASLLGRIGQTRGVLQSLFMVRPMKEALERVLELDPNYASAYYVLSMLYMEAPGWPLSIGNKDVSLENALQSVELDPTNYDFQYNLAVVYIDHNEKDKAREILEDLLDSSTVQEDDRKVHEVQELLSSL